MNPRELPIPGFLDTRTWWASLASFGKRFTLIEDKDKPKHRVVVRGNFLGLWWVWTDDDAKTRPGSFYMAMPARRDLRIINPNEWMMRIAGHWYHFTRVENSPNAPGVQSYEKDDDSPSEPGIDPVTGPTYQAKPPLTELDMVIGGKYNWIGQDERLCYVGAMDYPGNGTWHQFALIDDPGKVWCEVRATDLHMFEETKQ